jgi:hypothetical protein
MASRDLYVKFGGSGSVRHRPVTLARFRENGLLVLDGFGGCGPEDAAGLVVAISSCASDVGLTAFARPQTGNQNSSLRR